MRLKSTFAEATYWRYQHSAGPQEFDNGIFMHQFTALQVRLWPDMPHEWKFGGGSDPSSPYKTFMTNV